MFNYQDRLRQVRQAQANLEDQIAQDVHDFEQARKMLVQTVTVATYQQWEVMGFSVRKGQKAHMLSDGTKVFHITQTTASAML